MLAVVVAIQYWGNSFKGKYVGFHIDNEAIFNALNLLSICSDKTIELIRIFLGLACTFDFTYAVVWLPSKMNSLADASSCFSYSLLFKLAPYLNTKPSSKVLQMTGISIMQTSQKLLHFTYGMGSWPVYEQCTPPVKSLLSILCSYKVSTIAMDQSCQHPKMWL